MGLDLRKTLCQTSSALQRFSYKLCTLQVFNEIFVICFNKNRECSFLSYSLPLFISRIFFLLAAFFCSDN